MRQETARAIVQEQKLSEEVKSLQVEADHLRQVKYVILMQPTCEICYNPDFDGN